MSTPTIESQHTPGPWQVGFPVIAGKLPTLHDGTPYAEIKAGCGFAGGEEAGFQFSGFMKAADAYLLYAAPDLLEALEGMLQDSGACLSDNPESHGSVKIKKALLAIAKAKNLPTRRADDDGEPQSSCCNSEKPEPGGETECEDEPNRLGFTEAQIERADRLHDERRDRQWEGGEE